MSEQLLIGLVGCGNTMANHVKGYRLLPEAGFRRFCATVACICSSGPVTHMSFCALYDYYEVAVLITVYGRTLWTSYSKEH